MAYGVVLNQQFDGFTKDETLDNTTRTLLGLPTNSTPKDAFQALYLRASGMNVFNITVHYPDGTPWPNLELNGVTNLQGGPAVTDAYGTVLAASDSTNPTVSFSVYSDIQSFSQQINKDQYIITYVTLDTQYKSGFDEGTVFEITSNTSYNFSHAISSVDITGVGGGGGGSWGDTRDYPYGSGGGGGYVVTELGISLVEVGSSIQFVIGAGGKQGTSSDSKLGTDGGNTTITFTGGTGKQIIAAGGKTPDGSTTPVTGYTATGREQTKNCLIGGKGNGNGGREGFYISTNAELNPRSTDATDGSGYIFNESSLGHAGGGGGGAGQRSGTSIGGEPYGANTNQQARGPGGGGPGGESGYGGYRGQAWMRIHRS